MTLGLDLSLMQTGGGLLGNSTAVGAILDQLRPEGNGLAFDFLQDNPQLLIRDEKAAANQYLGSFNDKVSGAWTGPKVIGQLDDRELVTNQTMAGVVAGTPGTIPTGWSAITAPTGLTRQIIGTGVDASGTTYIEVRFSGTVSGAGQGINFDFATAVAGMTQQRFRLSGYVAIVGGTITGINDAYFQVREGDSVNALVTPPASNVHRGADVKSFLTSALQLFSYNLETGGGITTRQITPRFQAITPNGAAVDVTFRFGLPSFKRLDAVYDHAPHNYVRNSSMQGAAAGSPGTAPTNWAVNSNTAHLTRTIIGVETVNGIECLRIRFNGTNTSGGPIYPDINFEPGNQIVGVQGQTHTASVYAALVGGSLTGLTSGIRLRIAEFNSGATYITEGANANLALTSTLQRFTHTRTLTSATAAFASSSLSTEVANGVTYDFTLLVGLPQHERRAWAGTPIRTTNAARFPAVAEWFTSRNEIRNSVAAGAVAGSPGTLPTNWTLTNSAGCSWSVVGSGTQDGIPYVDVRVQGTASSGSPFIAFESTTQIVAAAGQSWASTFFCYLVSGSLTGIFDTQNFVREGDAGGTFVVSSSTAFTSNNTTTLSAARRTHLVASTNASTLRLNNRLHLNEAASGAVDATFRIALPQLEQRSFATDPIRTTGLAANGNTRLGVPIEGARTNEIRNNTMQGAVAGSPGTLPSLGWFAITHGTLTQTIVGVGRENGIDYLEVRLNGTTSNTACGWCLETATQIVAASGDTITLASHISLVGGSLTNISAIRLDMDENTSGGAFVINKNGADLKAGLTSQLRRFASTATLTGGGTVARVQPFVRLTFSSAVVIDITLRIGWPTLEKTSVPSLTPILTTAAAVTRPEDNPSLGVANFPSMAAGGHMMCEFAPGQVVATAHRALALSQSDTDTTFVGGNTTGKRAANLIATAGAPSLTPTGTLVAGQSTRIAYSFAVNNYKAASDGGTVQTSASGAALPTYATLRFGRAGPTSTDHLHGYLRRGRVVPRTLTDAETVALSVLAA